jgi:cytochrome c oxidase assembly factor CtaG
LLAHGGASQIGWQLEPAVVAAIALASALFARGFFRLRRRRPDHAPWTRAALFATALVLGGLAVLSPLDGIGEGELLSAHMLQHVVLADLVPALLLVSLRGPLLAFVLPVPVLRALPRAPLAFLFRPEVALPVWATFFAAWHIPVFYDAVLTRPPLHDLEHATFFLGGLLVWSQLVDPSRRRALTEGQKLGFALILFVCSQMLTSVLVFSGKPLYPAYAVSDGRFGLAALADQQAAALVMMVEQLATLGTFVALTLRARFRVPLVAHAERHPFAA